MGTVMTHKAFGPHAEDSLDAVCREIARIEGLLSRFSPGSELRRVNDSAGIKREKIGPETFEVLSKAVALSRRLQGCFGVTMAPLVDLWNAGKALSTPPDATDVTRALSLVDDRDVLLDPGAMTAGLKRAGQAIDLGAIGKGFAGDKIREVFESGGISSAYSNLGGNVVAVGAKPDGSPWSIGIQHPRRRDDLIGAVAVENQSVVTSGDYQRCFIDRQGKRRHHILNPATGYPSESGLISVSIVAASACVADALSTALFVAGMEKGLQFLAGFPDTGAILVDAAMRVYITQGLRNRFQAAAGVSVTLLVAGC